VVKPPKAKLWIALDDPLIGGTPKKVVEDDYFYIGKILSERQVADLDRIRTLLALGGDLTPYYRRSRAFDLLLKRQQIIHLHLGGPGSDAILYLIQYPEHVLFLAVDGHIHLDDIPPGKRFMILGRRKFERQVESAETTRAQAVAASVRALLSGIKPK